MVGRGPGACLISAKAPPAVVAAAAPRVGSLKNRLRWPVTPRPKRVYGMGNRRVTYVHQGLP